MSTPQLESTLPYAMPPSDPAARTDYNVAVGYLRAFATVLVIEHHAFLAYGSFLPPQTPFGDTAGWQAFPIVDPTRWAYFDLAIICNDLFLMSLMFFISGLFVWSSLRRKGRTAFLRDRVRRLGVPFLVAAGLVSPLAYYPTYLATVPSPSVADFAARWLALDTWPAGPAWFVWMLLVFDGVAALLLTPAARVGRAPMDRVWRVPTVFFRAIVALTAAVYLPMMFVFGPDTWTGIGPFAFQLSRILHYAAWFAAGVAVGAYGIDRSILATGGALAQRWLRWLGMAGVLYAVTVVAIATSISATTYVHARLLGFGVAFVLACAALNLAASALAVRFARRTRLLDSLRDNAYGMYLIHYAFVTWLQFALLRAGLPGVVKGVIAFAGATALSWLAVAALRRIPAVARIV